MVANATWNAPAIAAVATKATSRFNVNSIPISSYINLQKKFHSHFVIMCMSGKEKRGGAERERVHEFLKKSEHCENVSHIIIFSLILVRMRITAFDF